MRNLWPKWGCIVSTVARGRLFVGQLRLGLDGGRSTEWWRDCVRVSVLELLGNCVMSASVMGVLIAF